MDHNGTSLAAKGDPSKAFFIDMLTRDIGLSVCILDLVDNSVHSLISQHNLDVSQHLIEGSRAQRVGSQIEISYGPSRFTTTDNCGGVAIKDVEERVFLLGNPVEEKTQTGLGVYGIGMKRAFFKIGKEISFTSHTIREELRIDINVDSWRQAIKWEFPFTYARQKKSSSGGTTIEITQLHATVRDQFRSTDFKRLLCEKISTAYALFLKAGLKITVNGEEIDGELPELAETKGLRAVRHLIKDDGVEVLVVAGLSPLADKTPRGWYVFCNGRMVLEADKSKTTGWGMDSHPNFHSKFNHFLGYVYFSSKDVQKLPWNTTKDDVDRESPIYRRTLTEMWVHSRSILNFLNDLYPDLKEESEPEHALFKAAKAVTPQKIASRSDTVFAANVKKQSDDTPVSIQYRRPKKKLAKVIEVLDKGYMSASRIGEFTFDWFYDRNCK